MGCGKSKHDVASGNTTTLQREKPSISFKENEIESKHTNNNNINNVSLIGQLEDIESEIVKENGDEDNKDGEFNDGRAKEKINNEENKEYNLVEEPSNNVEKNNDETLIESSEKINDGIMNEDNVLIEEPYVEDDKNEDDILIENDEKINDIGDVSCEQEKILLEENKKEDVNVDEKSLEKEEKTNVTNSEAKDEDEKN